MIQERMTQHPKQTVCEENAEISYEELLAFIETFSGKIRNYESCAILCKSELMSAIMLLSCFAADVTAIPLSFRYGEKHYRKILKTLRPTCILSDLSGSPQIYRLQDSTYRPPKIHPALIMYTSGTTGSPKGAMLTEQNILANLDGIRRYFRLGESDRILITRPLYHCAVLTGEFLTALTAGAHIRFYSGNYNPYEISILLKKQNISVFCGTPTSIRMLLPFFKSGSIPLQKLAISGECLSKSVAAAVRRGFPNTKIYHVYGLTEACPRVAYLPPEFFDSCAEYAGIPLASVSLSIRDSEGNEVARNQKGTLFVKGENVMLGYYADSGQTHKVLKNRWLCTGDIAVIGENGFLKIIGRGDDLIIRAGMNIYPQEVESVLKENPKTEDVLVYGYKDALGNTQIGLKISGNFADVDEVKAACVAALPTFQMPTKIEIVSELPKNASGKIIRSIEK